MAAGASPPRDLQYLRRQQTIIDVGVGGGWTGRPEVRIRTGDGSERFIDVLLKRASAREALVVEVVDLFADVGEDLRGLERKVEAVRALRPEWRVHGMLVVRATNRNRELVTEFGSLLAARFSSGDAWLRALATDAPLPDGDAFLWSESRSGELRPARLPKPGSPPRRRPQLRGRAASGT